MKPIINVVRCEDRTWGVALRNGVTGELLDPIIGGIATNREATLAAVAVFASILGSRNKDPLPDIFSSIGKAIPS